MNSEEVGCAQERLTDEQCDQFRRLPLPFNDMVRAIYEAGTRAAITSTSVDWKGLALELDAQAKRVSSQTTERAMVAAAHGLRLMGENGVAPAQEPKAGICPACQHQCPPTTPYPFRSIEEAANKDARQIMRGTFNEGGL